MNTVSDLPANAKDLRDPIHAASWYSKKPRIVNVTFAAEAQVIDTMEGPVHCAAGDAIVTGIHGERWPVRRARFEEKYRAVLPTVLGQAGAYQTVPTRVLALRLDQATRVILPDARSTLAGAPGDWLVQYAPGDMAIVGADIFPATYELFTATVPLIVGVAGSLDGATRDLLAGLASLLQHTPLVVLTGEANGEIWAYDIPRREHAPLPVAPSLVRTLCATAAPRVTPYEHQAVYLLKNATFVVQPVLPTSAALAEAVAAFQGSLPYWTPQTDDLATCGQPEGLFTLPQPAPVLHPAGLTALLQALQAKAAPCGRWHRYGVFLASRVPRLRELARDLVLATEPAETSSPDALALLLANQIAELGAFNTDVRQFELAEAARPQQERKLVRDPAQVLERAWYTPVERLHAVADQLASRHQDAWQNLVYSSTKNMATTGGLANGLKKGLMSRVVHAWRHRSVSLVSLGLVATMALAAFTELSDNCSAQDPFAFLGCDMAPWKEWAGPLYFGVYLVAMLAAFGRYAAAKIAEHERKHQDYRLIAECLRVQHVWSSVGIRHYVADALPASEISEATWARNAVRAIRWMHAGDIGKWSATSVHWAVTVFVQEQLRYHQDTLIQRRATAARYLSARAQTALALFIGGIGVLLCNLLAEKVLHLGIDGVGHHLLVLGTVAMLGIWAANKKVLDNFGLEGEVQRGRAVLAALGNAQQFIDSERAASGDMQAQPNDRVRAALIGIGNVFVHDQANWHALHRSRPIEAVTGG